MKEVAKDEWHQNLDELRQYKAIFGDCLVPDNSEYSELFAWTVVQRREQGTMQRDRKRELDCLQFEWDGMRKDEDSDRWDQMFFELSQYKVINAHTNVQPWPNEPRVCELSAWCNIQRRDYANLWADRRSPLTENRIRQLNQVSGADYSSRRTIYGGCLHVVFLRIYSHCILGCYYHYLCVCVCVCVCRERERNVETDCPLLMNKVSVYL